MYAEFAKVPKTLQGWYCQTPVHECDICTCLIYGPLQSMGS